nr:alpha/beta hydrolase [Methylorubrum zatmanii]
MFHHGWPLSSDDWDAQMLFFAHQGFRVVAHDRRGHGRSAQVSEGHDMDHYAADAAAVASISISGTPSISAIHRRRGRALRRRHGEPQGRVAKAVLVSAVPAADAEDRGQPGGPADRGLRRVPQGAGRQPRQFFLDVAAGPFYGFNRDGAAVRDGVIRNWWRQGMMGSAKAHYEGIKAFSETDQTEDLRAISVPTLVLHGEDDQIVPIVAAARKSITLLRNGTLKTYPGLPHGMLTVNADQLNADILAFIRG